MSNEIGVAKNVHYGDVLIKFGEVLDVSIEQLPMISDESILGKYKASFLQNGDVIVADTAEDLTVGKCSEIAGLKDEVVLSGLHTIPYRPTKKFSSGYLGYYLNSGAYHDQLIPLMQGIKVTSISKSAMQDTSIIYPKLEEEQRKIGTYFRSLDELITLHQCKYNGDQRIDLFAWEQRKLGELASSFEYGLNAAAKEYDGENKYIRITDIDDNTHEFLTDNLTSPDIELTGADNYKLTEGDILFARTGASVGKSYIYKNSDGLVYYAGFLIRARIKEEYDAEFVFQNTLTDRYNKYIAVTSQRSGQPGVNAQEYAEFEIKVPQKEEQTKIGTYFHNIDHLITLHQRKCDQAKILKKYMLQKMFPQNDEKVPKIRFKGFTDDWEQRKLGEVLVSLQNNTLSRADLSNEIGVAKNVHYGDVLIKFGEVLDVSIEQLPMISDESILGKYKASFLQNGDVIVADTAEDLTVGKCSEIAGLKDEVVLSGLHTIPYRPTKKFSSGYLGYYLNSGAYHDQLIPLMQGIKVTSISKSAMQDTSIIYPKLEEEQRKIGTYFRSLDELITLHQHKCEELKNIKKFMLQNMFVQEK